MIKEEGAGSVFVLEVVLSNGAAAYVVGTALRRKVFALWRHGLRRQARVTERDAASHSGLQPDLDLA
jgi:hypothetical protein